MLAQEQIDKVVAEAKTWVGTPYKGWSRVKHAGADCGQIIYAVFRKCGHIPEIHDLPTDYRIDVAQHRASTEYVDLIAKYFDEIQEAETKAGDLVVYKLGLAFAHAGIIVEVRGFHDFYVVDAQLHGGVKIRHGYNQPKFQKAEKKFFRLKECFEEVRIDATVYVQGVTWNVSAGEAAGK